MKVTQLKLRSKAVNLSFKFQGLTLDDPYILKNIDGLGPPDVNTSLSRSVDETAVYQGGVAESRELVIRLALNPNYKLDQSVSDLRVALYGLLSIDDATTKAIYIGLTVMNGITPTVYDTEGFVKKIEVVPFNKDPEVQITIGCTSPYFNAGSRVTVDVGELVYPNPEFVYTSSAPTNVHMELVFNRAITYPFDIVSYYDEADLKVYGPFVYLDKLIVDSIPGNRGVWLERSGVRTSILQNVTNLQWFKVYKGVNKFSAYAADLTFTSIYYYPRSWGV